MANTLLIGRPLLLFAPFVLAWTLHAQESSPLNIFEIQQAAVRELFDQDRVLVDGEVRVEFRHDGPAPDMQVSFQRVYGEDGIWKLEVWHRPKGARSIFNEIIQRYPDRMPTVSDVLSWAEVQHSVVSVGPSDGITSVLAAVSEQRINLRVDTPLYLDSAEYQISLRSGDLRLSATVRGERSTEPTNDPLLVWLRRLREAVERLFEL